MFIYRKYDPFHLSIWTENNILLATASTHLETGLGWFYIWEGSSGQHRADATQVWEVKPGRMAEEVWLNTVEFELHRVAMAEWDRLRARNLRSSKFTDLMGVCELILADLHRGHATHWEVGTSPEDHTPEIVRRLTGLVDHLKKAQEFGESIRDEAS